jgi:anti-sigma factor RsiW
MAILTRDVVSDLWPLYLSGDLSTGTCRVVEEFLAEDPEFAARLRATPDDSLDVEPPPALPPDHELRTLQRVKRRLWGYPMLLQLAIVFSAGAFGRIVSDTSWDVSPRNFIITASIAAAFWVAFFVTLVRGRRALLVRLR